MKDEPVKIVAEAQFMLLEYLQMRPFTHYWYKIARAQTPYVSPSTASRLAGLADRSVAGPPYIANQFFAQKTNDRPTHET